MKRPTWEVLIVPATGCGQSFWERIEAQNGVQAKQIMKSRFPSNWTIGNNPRRLDD